MYYKDGVIMELYKNFCEESFDDNGVLCHFKLKYEDNYNFGYDVVDKLAELDPNGRAVQWCDVEGNEKTFTFSDISRLSNKAANVLRDAGIKKGDRVLVILKRNYEYWYVAPALHKLGAVMIPATHMLTVEDMIYRIETANITAAVCTLQSGAAEKLSKAQASRPELRVILTPGGTEGKSLDFTTLMETAPESLERVETSADEPMLLYFTSGTTGYPKAVMHDHTYSLSHIVTAKYWQCVIDGGLHLTVAETGWGKASWGKIYGQWLCGSAVMVYDFDNFTPDSLMTVIEKYRVTTFCAPPTVYRYFIKRDMKKYDLSSLTHITTAGEALNPEVFKKVRDMTGLEIYEGFGQTESTLLIGNLKNSTLREGSIGKASPFYNVKIQKEDGSFALPGEPGEIVVLPEASGKTHGIFMGYCGDDKTYAKVWRGGIYHTGDTAYMDKDGYFYFVGRADDLIKTCGFRVSPFEIESILMEHPAVLECAVTGVPDRNRGQAIKATIVLTKDYEPSDKLKSSIQNFVNSKTASYKHIRIIEFIGEMSKTISGKIRHAAIRANAITPYERRVNYYETDKMNVVHNSNYIRYFEEARIDYLEKINCPYLSFEENGISMPTIKTGVDYLSPLKYNDSFKIEVKLKEFNGVKIKFEYRITRDDKLISTGFTTHCFVDSAFKPLNINRKFKDISKRLYNAKIK